MVIGRTIAFGISSKMDNNPFVLKGFGCPSRLLVPSGKIAAAQLFSLTRCANNFIALIDQTGSLRYIKTEPP